MIFSSIEFQLNWIWIESTTQTEKVLKFCCVSAAIGSKIDIIVDVLILFSSKTIHRTFDNVQCGRNVKAAGGRWARNAPIVNVLLFG